MSDYTIFFLYTGFVAWLTGSVIGFPYDKRVTFGEYNFRFKHTLFGSNKIFLNDRPLLSQFAMLPRRFEIAINVQDTLEVEQYIKWHGLSIGINVRINGKLVYSDKYN